MLSKNALNNQLNEIAVSLNNKAHPNMTFANDALHQQMGHKSSYTYWYDKCVINRNISKTIIINFRFAISPKHIIQT